MGRPFFCRFGQETLILANLPQQNAMTYIGRK
nr:MAG TPA: Mediator complex subunit 30 [Caudoviricetes sp.]